MRLEYTKHMTEKDLHRNLPSVRDIRRVLLHFSLVKPAIETVVPNVRCATR